MFQPDTRDGLETIGHEFSHVAQQARGGYAPNIPGTAVHLDARTEAASDVAGRGFADSLGSGMASAAASGPALAPISAQAAPIQGTGFVLDSSGNFDLNRNNSYANSNRFVKWWHRKQIAEEQTQRYNEWKAARTDPVESDRLEGVNSEHVADARSAGDLDDDWLNADDGPQRKKKNSSRASNRRRR